MNNADPLGDLQQRLVAAATDKTRIWWEKYLRGAAAFRGVPIPRIRAILAEWRVDSGVADRPLADQLDLALKLIAVPITEDKLAGILLLQDHLRARFDWRELLPRYARLYAEGWISDWNTSDWFCVRVLGPTLQEAGLPFARALARWRTAPVLWQARSAVVPFIAVAGDTAYRPLIRTVCATLIRRPERFAKTGVGWLLREISRHDRAFVAAFIAAHAAGFSVESARNALKYFPASEAARLPAAVRSEPARATPRGRPVP